MSEMFSMRSTGEADLFETLYFVICKKKKFTVELFIKRAEMSGTLETNSFLRQEAVLEAHLTRPEDGWKQTITNNPNHTITSFNNIESIQFSVEPQATISL